MAFLATAAAAAIAAIGTTVATAGTAAAAGGAAAGTTAAAGTAAAGTAAGSAAAASAAGSAALAGAGTFAAGTGVAASTAGGAAASAGVLGTGISAGTAGLAVSGVSGAGSLGFGIMQQAKTQQMYKEQEARQALMAQRQQMDTLKQARVATGQATQNAANQGTINSSASEGGIGGIQSALTGNLSYLTQFNNKSDEASADAQSASVFGSASKLGSTIFDENSEGNIFG